MTASATNLRRRTWVLAIIALLVGPAHAQDHRGGTFRLLASSAAGTIDPQINYTGQYWQLFTIVYDGLVAFRKVEGAAGMVLVPDLADAIPEPSDEGRTYVFHLRPGIRFDGGRPVRPKPTPPPRSAASFACSARPPAVFTVRSPGRRTVLPRPPPALCPAWLPMTPPAR